MEQNLISPSAVSILIVSPNGIPLIKDPKKPLPNYWKLPGGRGEPGELPEETAIREAKEETGLSLKEDGVKIVYKEERDTHDFYLAQSDITSLKGLKSIGNEGEEVKLFLPEDIKKLPDFFPPHLRVLKEIKFI